MPTPRAHGPEMRENRELSPTPAPEDSTDAAMRPRTLKDFVGQRDVCANLDVFIQAAKHRREALDHILFYGPPGLGKTTLAQIMAAEMNVGFRATSGPIILRAGDLAALLTNLQPFDVLFIDEIHRLSPAVEEILYPAMEDFELDFMIGEGPAARSLKIPLPPFTLIGATTRSGLITTPLRDRFGIPIRLAFYAPEDLQHIVDRNATLLKMTITPEGAFEIAKRSRGTPRIAGRLLRRVRDFAHAAGTSHVTQEVADAALSRLDVDASGLDAMDRRYLQAIVTHYQGGPVGVETLAAYLSEHKGVLEDVIEPYLIQRGLLQRTSRGRMATLQTFQYFGVTPPVSFQDRHLGLEQGVDSESKESHTLFHFS